MKHSLRLGWTLFLITGMTGLLLGLVNQTTEGPIERAKAEELRQALQIVLPSAGSFETVAVPDGIEEGVLDLHRGQNSGKTAGYCVTVETKGYGGPIRFVVGLDTGGTVTGLTLLAGSETPGLGAKASEETFRNRYVGQNPDHFSVTKSQEPRDGEIQALSGATITSRAITEGVNIALRTFRMIPKEGDR